MKRYTRTALLSLFAAVAAAVIATLVITKRETGSAALSPQSIGGGDASQAGNSSSSAQLHPGDARSPRKELETATDWLAAISKGGGSIGEKIDRLKAGLPQHSITALWQDLLKQGDWIRDGHLPGGKKWESEMIFNALLDALVVAGSASPDGAGAAPGEEAAAIFGLLIAAEPCDGVLRDYSIQRGLMLAADSLLSDSPGREGILAATLGKLTIENLSDTYPGTALNTLGSYHDQWSGAERVRITESIAALVSSLPADPAGNYPNETDGPSLQARIPLMGAVATWGIAGGIPLITQAVLSDKPALQIPAIAAWCRLPEEMRGQPAIGGRIGQWAATAGSPLQYAATSAIRHTQPSNP